MDNSARDNSKERYLEQEDSKSSLKAAQIGEWSINGNRGVKFMMEEDSGFGFADIESVLLVIYPHVDDQQEVGL